MRDVYIDKISIKGAISLSLIVCVHFHSLLHGDVGEPGKSNLG